MPSEVTESDKTKITAAKPEIHVSPLVVEIESKFQVNYHVFDDAKLNGTKETVV